MGAETLTDADRVVQAIWFSIWMGVVLAIFFFLTHRGADGAPMRWQRWWSWFAARYVTSSTATRGAAENDRAVGAAVALLPGKRNGETGENGVATGKTEGNDPFQFPDLFTGLARLVLAEKLGETDALKIAVKASPGKSPRYSVARARLHAAMERERLPTGPQFQPLTPEQQALRDQLGLSNRF